MEDIELKYIVDIDIFPVYIWKCTMKIYTGKYIYSENIHGKIYIGKWILKYILEHIYWKYKVDVDIFLVYIWKYIMENIYWKIFILKIRKLKIYTEIYTGKIYCKNIYWKNILKMYTENINRNMHTENILWEMYTGNIDSEIYAGYIHWKYV